VVRACFIPDRAILSHSKRKGFLEYLRNIHQNDPVFYIQQTLTSRGLRFYVITALLGFGIAWASGIYLALMGFRGNPAECSSSCLIGAVPAGLGSLLILVCGHRAFIRFVTETAGSKSKRAESLEIGDGLEEKRILEIVREILSHRRVAKRLRNVDTLAWSDMQGWDSTRFKWQGYRKPSMLVICKGLRGKLETEDWRTYLCWRYLRLTPGQTLHVAQPSIQALLVLLLFTAAAVSLAFNLGLYHPSCSLPSSARRFSCSPYIGLVLR
jgi:hypothetical protein